MKQQFLAMNFTIKIIPRTVILQNSWINKTFFLPSQKFLSKINSGICDRQLDPFMPKASNRTW